MQISFAKSQLESELILINSDAVEVVNSVKLLGLQIVVQWSLEKSDQLNTDNGQEMQFSFAKSQQESELLCIYSDVIEVVDSVKLLGLNISSDLT